MNVSFSISRLAILAALLFCASAHAVEDEARRLSPLSERPAWRTLHAYQQTITRAEFVDLLNRVYAPGGAWKEVIQIEDERALIQMGSPNEFFELRFAPSRVEARPVRRFWRGRNEITGRTAKQPLRGVRITLDPGHIGGNWARMEERWFQIGDTEPVREGDMVLYVAELLKERLKELGAVVTLTRSRPRPVTSLRPEQLRGLATQVIEERGQEVTPRRVQLESERLFYRVAEIRRRARLVNERLRPDLVLALHFNAEAWGDETRPTLSDKNHLHFLITGAFSAGELSYEDQRFNMIQKMLTHAYSEELAVTERLADSMAAATKLPPYVYLGSNAVKLGQSPYIWGRNLLANRLFNCPVVYLEPYVMNSREVFARIQAGDYDGEREVAGEMRPSIFREYVDSVVKGLVEYYFPN